MSKSIAVYAGSFSPITLGHLDIIEKARNLFDVIYVSVGHNENKTSLFTVNERIKLIKCSMEEYGISNDTVNVTSFDGLLIDHAELKNATHLVRGLRAASDFDAEFTLNGTNSRMNNDIVTTFFMAPQDFLFVSSSTVKVLAPSGKDISWMVTPCVEAALKEKFK